MGGQIGRREGDAEDGEPHALAGAGAEGPGGGPQAAGPSPGGVQLAQHVAHGVGELRHAAGGGPVRELGVSPQELEHPHEVGLPGAVEAAHPHGGLGRPAQVLQVGVEDGLQPPAVLAVADERGELVAQDFPLFRGGRFAYLGYPVVGQPVLQRVAGENVAVQEARQVLPPSCAVIGMAR